MPVQFKQWSFSRWRDYERCPLQAKLRHLAKLPQSSSPVLERGNKVHHQAAKYLVDGGRVPKSLSSMAKHYRELRKKKLMVEQKWAFDKKWKPVGFFDSDAWVRIVCDVVAYDDPEETTILIVDHKTSKVNQDFETQLELYVVGAFAKFPKVKFVRVELWYVDFGVKQPQQPRTYSRKKDFAALKKKWAGRVRAMLNDKRLPARPGNQCRWCDWTAEKGGPCEF